MSAYPFNWSKIQSANEIDIGRHFEYDSDAMAMFRNWLPFVEEKIQVLEVGSGSGFFTGKLQIIYPSARITCLEPDLNLRKSLSRKFPSINIVDIPLEEIDFFDEFDAAISHIVIHNLPKPLIAIEKMKQAVRKEGYVICIEPALGSRHFVPDKSVGEAFDTLWQYSIIMSKKRAESFGKIERSNPFYYSYPDFFEKVGLENIRCHGLYSVFTLSDARFDFRERKKWIKRRRELFEDQRVVTTQTLLESGLESSKINEAYQILFDYFRMLEDANKEQLSHIHEQEIVSRSITIGQKK
ncbi:class I SAM-dependent methyltransferase [Candidatus Thorarchaeota archaeon]|nr:MAG: class I SAM-dependent methyltransferase [Candidatus Thorarchaeota archaeon]